MNSMTLGLLAATSCRRSSGIVKFSRVNTFPVEWQHMIDVHVACGYSLGLGKLYPKSILQVLSYAPMLLTVKKKKKMLIRYTRGA